MLTLTTFSVSVSRVGSHPFSSSSVSSFKRHPERPETGQKQKVLICPEFQAAPEI